MTSLRLADAETSADLGAYLRRAKGVDPDGDVRLQAVGPVLAAWTCVVPGSGLLGAGLVLGLRTSALAEPADLDVTVPIGAVTDRLARDETDLPLPPVASTPPWAAVSPPRSGWELVGEVSADDLTAAAREGIEEVAVGAPSGSGAAAVADLRRRVWGRSTRTVPPVPSGGAFGLHVLGFLGGEGAKGMDGAGRAPVVVRACGPWTRLTTPSGHVLTR